MLRSRIDVVGTGLGFGEPPEPKAGDHATGRVLFIARQRFHDKGADLARDAALLPVGLDPTIRMVIVGVGPSLAALAGTSGIEIKQNLEFAELHDEYRAAPRFILPAWNEPRGLVYLEAMSFGLPIMDLSSNAIPEICGDGQFRYVIPYATPAEVARSIVTALSDPDGLRRCGISGKQHSSTTYTWHNVVEFRLNLSFGTEPPSDPTDGLHCD